MAPKKVRYKKKLDKHMQVRRLIAAVSLIAFLVIMIASFRQGLYASSAGLRYFADLTIWTAWKAFLVLVVIKIGSVIILKVLNTYEETSSG